jgi:hypothetical protein
VDTASICWKFLKQAGMMYIYGAMPLEVLQRKMDAGARGKFRSKIFTKLNSLYC